MAVIGQDGVIFDASVSVEPSLRRKMGSCGPAILVNREHKIVGCNQAWRSLCGYGAEAIGRSPKILHGDLTQTQKAKEFTQTLCSTGSGRMTIVNYNKSGEAFVQKLEASTITDKNGQRLYFTESTVVTKGAIRDAMLRSKSTEDLSFAQASAIVVALALVSFVVASGVAESSFRLMFPPEVMHAIDPQRVSTAVSQSAQEIMALALIAIFVSVVAISAASDAEAAGKSRYGDDG